MKKQVMTKSSRGASLIEYVLVAALIAIVALVATKAVGTALSTKMDTVAVGLN